MGLIKKLGYIGRAGLAAGAIYAISLLPSGCSTKVNEKPIQKPKIELNLPDKLTQQTPDFYKNPEKEFEFYKKTFINLAKDGIINSEDVATLESTLSKTLEEIKDKICEMDGKLKTSLPHNEEIRKYMNFITVMGERDLQELKAHLDSKKSWLNSNAVKGKFWNYGLGTFVYMGQSDNGNTGHSGGPIYRLSNGLKAKGLPRLFRENELYRHISSGSIVKGNYNYPRVPQLSEEFPAKTKFNYWIGLLVGFLIPPIMGGIALPRKRRKRSHMTEEQENWTVFCPLLWNFAPGFLMLDGLHPLVYPIRLGIPMIYEAGQWLLGGKKKKKTQTSSPIPREHPKPKPKPKPSLEETVEEKKEEPKFINPWEVEIQDLRGKRK